VYVHDILTYSDNTRLNRDNADLRLSGFHQSAKSRFEYSGTYKENSQNDASNNLAGDLAQRNITSIRLNNEWNMTAKSSVAIGYQLQDIKYDNSVLYDRQHTTIPLNYYWGITPKLDMSVGYRNRNTSFEGGAMGSRPDLDDQFFNVGVRGVIGSKTTGEIRIGTQKRDFNTPGVKDENLLSADARITWAATEKSDFTLVVSRDFNADAFGTSIESTDVQVGGTTAISEYFNGFASIRLSSDDYNGGRSDDGLFGQIGVSYTPNAYSAFSLAYILYNNDSSYLPADFDNNVFNISGTLRY
ncbi:MAG: outer membrane beta-barrel protein, partial [Verrucomicrobiae bacterium]|nr:outer membrane beta-barrel protein [Verrucomicrobiae bacterium]